MKILFALLLLGATAPLQAHWFRKLKALEEAAKSATPVACQTFAESHP